VYRVAGDGPARGWQRGCLGPGHHAPREPEGANPGASDNCLAPGARVRRPPARPGTARPATRGAFAGLRVAEACGLRTADMDFMRGVAHPAVQYPAEP